MPKGTNSFPADENSSSGSEGKQFDILEDNLKAFLARQKTGIKKARKVYIKVGRPSNNKFLRIVKYREFPNIPKT